MLHQLEGLLELMGTDDWKRSWIPFVLTDARNAAPRDVLEFMQDGVDEFDLQVDCARAIAERYPVFLKPETKIEETCTVRGVRSEPAAQRPTPKKAARAKK